MNELIEYMPFTVFFKECEDIKNKYNNLSKKEKWQFKRGLYKNKTMTAYFKDLEWSYLNNDLSYNELINPYQKLKEKL